MTLEEAIKLLTELRPMLAEVGFDKYKASLDLGISALLCLTAQRHLTVPLCNLPLPGETED